MEQNIDIFKYLASHSPNAVAKVAGGSQYPQISGVVRFFALPAGVIVAAEIENLPQTQTNVFAFHVHEGNSCGDNFAQTGGHYNPGAAPHPLHAGDMPPLFSNNGFAWQAFFTNRFKVDEIIGRTVIIHDGVDDFTSQPSGNSGQKIACGEIAAVTIKQGWFKK